MRYMLSAEDLIDFFFQGKNPFYNKHEKRFRFFAIPLIAYDPATSVQLGAGIFFASTWNPKH